MNIAVPVNTDNPEVGIEDIFKMTTRNHRLEKQYEFPVNCSNNDSNKVTNRYYFDNDIGIGTLVGLPPLIKQKSLRDSVAYGRAARDCTSHCKY